jgi:hypothetical protein
VTDSTVALVRNVHRWKTMSPNISEHPNYSYIEVVRASDYDALIEHQQRELAERDKRIERLEKDAERLNYLMRIAEYKPEGWREAEWRIRFPVLPEHSFKSAIDAAIAGGEGQ